MSIASNEIKILLVDDEEDILEFLSYNFKKEGFSVWTADNGKKALEIAKEKIPHVIILDVMMPELDGIETCSRLRKIPSLQNTLIAFLTAREEDHSQLAGFDVGADDYINKPIKPKLLISRVKALLRRHSELKEDTQIQVGNLIIDEQRFLVLKEDQPIEFPNKEFYLLQLLASQPGKVFSREEIMNKIWGLETIVGDRTIDVHIRKIREKLGEDVIKTIKGIGYKLDL